MTTLQIEMNKKFTREVVDDFTTQRAQDHPAVPCLVFLYRSVFSETGIFDELEPYAANYRVEFFDPTQRRDYLRRYLESKGDKGKQLVPMVGQFRTGSRIGQKLPIPRPMHSSVTRSCYPRSGTS